LAEELSDAKDSLLGDVEKLNFDKFPKVSRRRRNSVGKLALDMDDIFSVLTYLDENGHLGKLSTFCAKSPDKMPSIRLVDGDLAIIWNKLTTLTDILGSGNNMHVKCVEIVTQSSDMIKNIQKEICTVKLHQQGMLFEKPTCGFNQPVDNSEAPGTPGFIKRGLKDIRANQHSRKPNLEAPPTETDSDINSKPFSIVVSRLNIVCSKERIPHL